MDLWKALNDFLPVLLTYMQKESHMNFLLGAVIGILLGGAAAFIYFSVTGKKPQ